MKVISDTGPINYLLLIGHIDIIRDLYGEVILPNAVLHELRHPQAPPVVRAWANALPQWVKTGGPTQLIALGCPLDKGEHEAISLAVELKADLLIVDEAIARSQASELKVVHVGTVGIIVHAARRGF